MKCNSKLKSFQSQKPADIRTDTTCRYTYVGMFDKIYLIFAQRKQLSDK